MYQRYVPAQGVPHTLGRLLTSVPCPRHHDEPQHQSACPAQPRHDAGNDDRLRQQPTRPEQHSGRQAEQPTHQVLIVSTQHDGDHPDDPTPPTSQESDTVTTIRITVGGETITGELNDNPTAQDLAGQLPARRHPLRLQRRRESRRTSRPLTMDGVPAGADPEINDIGYYRPTNGLVFYYGDVGYFNGIVRIGRLSASDMQLIRRQTGSFTITSKQADAVP